MLHLFNKIKFYRILFFFILLIYSSCTPTETTSKKNINKNTTTKCKIENLNNSLSIQKLTKLIDKLEHNPPDILNIDIGSSE